MLLCMQLGLVVWTLVRFTQIEHWSPGIRFFGSEMVQTTGLTKSAVSNLQEGTWFHLLQIRQNEGIIVAQIENGSPADLVGLQSGDRIISVNGIDLRSTPDAYFQVRLQSQPGDLLELVWLHDDRIHTGILTLEETEEVPYALQVDQQQIVMGVGAMTWFQRGPFLIFPIVLLGFGTWMGFRSPAQHHRLSMCVALPGYRTLCVARLSSYDSRMARLGTIAQYLHRRICNVPGNHTNLSGFISLSKFDCLWIMAT